MSFQFVVDGSAVASEVIDGEAIIMHLRSGFYFSSRGTGAAVWEMLCNGATDSGIATVLSQATGAAQEQIRADIDAYVAVAQTHGLGRMQEVVDEEPELPTNSWSGTWQPPVLEVFHDMQDLLLLDPIHDVSNEVGWPMQKPV